MNKGNKKSYLRFKTTQQRSELMKKIKSTDTKPEVFLRKKLWSLGYRYRKNYKNLPGKPDIVFPRYKLAIFIDGEFWHGYNWKEKKSKIKSNPEYWIKKIEDNINRDNQNIKLLKSMGWTTIRFWQKEIQTNIEGCIEKIINQIKIISIE